MPVGTRKNKKYTVDDGMREIRIELERASIKFGPFVNAHHAYAVILEELDEAWHDIKHGTKKRAREEIVQTGAMCLRFLMDIK